MNVQPDNHMFYCRGSAKWTVATSCRLSSASRTWSVLQTDGLSSLCCTRLLSRVGLNSKEVLRASDQLLLLLLFGSGRDGQTATHPSAFLLHGCCASLLQKRTTEGKYTCLRNAFNIYFYTQFLNTVAVAALMTRRRQRCHEWDKEKRVQFEACMDFQCCAKRGQTFVRSPRLTNTGLLKNGYGTEKKYSTYKKTLIIMITLIIIDYYDSDRIISGMLAHASQCAKTYLTVIIFFFFHITSSSDCQSTVDQNTQPHARHSFQLHRLGVILWWRYGLLHQSSALILLDCRSLSLIGPFLWVFSSFFVAMVRAHRLCARRSCNKTVSHSQLITVTG